MHVLTKLCVFRGFIFLFLSFPSDRDSSTKSSVNKIEKNGVTFWFPSIKRPHTHQPSGKLPLQQWHSEWDSAEAVDWKSALKCGHANLQRAGQTGMAWNQSDG